MATWNFDGTTTYVPGESNARAVPPPVPLAAGVPIPPQPIGTVPLPAPTIPAGR
jgi:hypothetical protein